MPDPPVLRARGSAHSNRRRFLSGSALVLLSGFAPGCARAQDYRNDAPPPTPEDWPEWMATPERIYRRHDALFTEAADIRSFGARLDGMTDDAPALDAAIRSGARAIAIPGGAEMRLDSPIEITRGVAILGGPGGCRIAWYGNDKSIFAIRPADGSPESFVRDIVFDRIEIRRALDAGSGGWLAIADNVCGLAVTRCRAERMNLVLVRHMREALGLYGRKRGSVERDPAVIAGFSPDHTDDLNENIAVIGNRVDYGKYQGSIVRFNFARSVVAYRNIGNHAKISWWGGAARIAEGGAVGHLRRVRQVYVAENDVNGANGGVYGNNGQHVVVARNRIRDMTDVGVDFEGCLDCVAYDNDVRNIGNFAYATFYAARNIVFHDNYGEQDGSGATLHKRFGAGRYGASRGIYLAAMRSAGFTLIKGAISVSFLRNRLVYSGPGRLGACLPSFFTELLFENNELVNVCCDWRYRRTGRTVLRNNRLIFDHAPVEPATLMAASGYDGIITGNRISVGAAFPGGSVGIGYQMVTWETKCVIADNVIDGVGRGHAPVAVVAMKGFRGRATVRGNSGAPVLFDEPMTTKLIASNNRDARGIAVSPRRFGGMIPRLSSSN